MSSSLNEISYNLLELYNAGKLSDDYTPNLRQLKFIVKYWRASAIRDTINKEGAISLDGLEQPLCNIVMSLPDEDCGCAIPANCTVYQSVKKIPQLIRLRNEIALTIYSASGKKVINHAKFDEVPYLGANKYIGNNAFWWLYKNKINYISGANSNSLPITKLSGKGLFFSPEEAYINFGDCTEDGVPCYTDDDEFPMTGDMIQRLTQAIGSVEFKMLMMKAQDDINDGNDGR